MNTSGNRSINLGLCAREEYTNVTFLSYPQEEQLAGSSNQAQFHGIHSQDLPARTHPKWRSGNMPTP